VKGGSDSPLPLSPLSEISGVFLSLSNCLYVPRFWNFWSPEFPLSLTLGNPGFLRDSTENRAIP